MIFDFPTIKHETIDIEIAPNYVHRKTVITRTFWLRIIWMKTQKTIILGHWRVHFTYEPDAAEHLETVLSQTGPDWWEK